MRSMVVLLVLAACQPSEDPRRFAARAAERKPSDEHARDKRERIDSLRTMHAVIAAQPAMIERMAATAPLTEAARSGVTEKLVVFRMRIDETGDTVESMLVVEARDWSRRDAAVSEARWRTYRLVVIVSRRWPSLSSTTQHWSSASTSRMR